MIRYLLMFILLPVTLFSYELPEVLNITNEYWVTHFAPIGWSHDGKIAYMTYDEVDGRGGTLISVTIFDAIEDRIKWQQKLDTYDYINEVDISETVENFFFSEDVQNALSVYNIEENIGQYMEFPFDIDGITFHCSVNPDYDYSHTNYIGTPGFNSYQIVMNRFNQADASLSGSKIIHEKRYNVIPDWLFGVNIVGCLLSPFEERALVIFSQLEADFENPQTYYFYSGAHLGYGFDDPLNTYVLRPNLYEQ